MFSRMVISRVDLQRVFLIDWVDHDVVYVSTQYNTIYPPDQTKCGIIVFLVDVKHEG